MDGALELQTCRGGFPISEMGGAHQFWRRGSPPAAYHRLQLLAFGQQGKGHLLAQIAQAGHARCAVGVVHKGGLDLIPQRFWVVDVGLQHGAVDKEAKGLKACLGLLLLAVFVQGEFGEPIVEGIMCWG